MLYHKIHFLSEDAEWVVFVHGAGGSSAVWFKQIKDYKKNFNVLLVDLRGHGKSAPRPEAGRYDYSFESIASDISLNMEVNELSK